MKKCKVEFYKGNEETLRKIFQDTIKNSKKEK